MAKIELENKNNCKQRLALEDCEIGDIVLLNNEIYLVVDGNSCSPTFILLNLKEMEEQEFRYNTICSRYKKPLRFDKSDFQEYVD